MQRRCLLFVFFLCQFLMSNSSSGFVTADAIECVIPVWPVYIRFGRIDQPQMSEDKKREIFARLRSYFQRSNSLLPAPNTPISEGVGEVFVSGDDLSAGGVTDVEGSVPITGTVTFGGPVRAAGTVTIAGRCCPARFAPLSISPPLLQMQSFSSPFSSVSEVSLDPPPPAFLPSVSLPPIIIPAIVIPAYVVPEVVLPADMVEIGPGGEILVNSDDIFVYGNNHIDVNSW